MTQINIPEIILQQVKENRQNDVSVSAKDAIDYINNYANNICVDYSKNAWKDCLENPFEQLHWLDTAVDGVWCFVQYAALLADALDLTEDELLRIDDDDREYPFIPENWSSEVKAEILQKHIQSLDDAAAMYRDFAARNPEHKDEWVQRAQEEEKQARCMRERLERLECEKEI